MTQQNRVLNDLIDPNGPMVLIIKAQLKPVGDQDRFQPAGFPEIGHVIYDAPRGNGRTEKVCIVDSPASMANHLEKVCLADECGNLKPELQGLPYVACVTDRNYLVQNGQVVTQPNDPRDRLVTTTLMEGHRLASDYFLEGKLKEEKPNEGKSNDETFREVLRSEFGIIAVKQDKTYFIPPESWWQIYQAIFKYDPNSLVHGVMFAKEQIKVPRFLTAHLEAFGAARVGRSGVKFDRLGKTVSGQPIFAVDEETAHEIRATFILDLAWLRSLGTNDKGLNQDQKRMLLCLALWKIKQLLRYPWRYRTQCHLETLGEPIVETIGGQSTNKISFNELSEFNVKECIELAYKEDSRSKRITEVYYPADKLFKVAKEESETSNAEEEETEEEEG